MILTIGMVAFIVIIVAIAAWVSVTRVSRQRVSMHDGQLITTAMGEREAGIPTSDIGVLLYVHENERGDARYKMGVFDYGGIIILNKAHRLIRVIQHYSGSTLALEPIYDQIPADQKIEFTGQRRDLVRMFPGSLGAFQLRGMLFWALLSALVIFIAIIVVAVIAALLASL